MPILTHRVRGIHDPHLQHSGADTFVGCTTQGNLLRPAWTGLTVSSWSCGATCHPAGLRYLQQRKFRSTADETPIERPATGVQAVRHSQGAEEGRG